MNKKRKHADVIIAWANGADIEYRSETDDAWYEAVGTPNWYYDVDYRVKQNDVIRYAIACQDSLVACNEDRGLTDNLAIRFDGKTGKIKSVEILK